MARPEHWLRAAGEHLARGLTAGPDHPVTGQAAG
jgi:hypothetical protein